MQFAQPVWLLVGVAACVALVWLYRQFDSRQRIALTQFVSARLLPKLTSSLSSSRRLAKRGLFVLGVALLFVALARPQAGFEFRETHRKGIELLFAVDTSKSMLAQDVKPDRLTRAKLGVTDFVAKLNGDGVGLIAFAGSSFLQCPVTLDYDAFRESLDALDVNVIPRGGTDIASAIHEAEAVFKTRTATDKVLILITDGEDLGGDAINAAQSAAKKGVKIFTVGVGSTTGELVPVPNENGGVDFARDENGKPVRSHLDETTLKKIAAATGGMYEPLGAQGEGLTKIYEQGLTGLKRQDLTARQEKVPLEKFHWALLAALACFIAEFLIGNRRKTLLRFPLTAGLNRMPKHVEAESRLNGFCPHNRAMTGVNSGVKKMPQSRTATSTAALLLLAAIASTQAASPQTAEQAYLKGDFAKSQQEYAAAATKKPAQAELQFNTGSAAYKAGDYAQAASGFEKSLKTDQVPLQQNAYYNLGNTKYRQGEKIAKENPQETIKTWEEAVKSYDAALQIKSDDADAKHNRDVVKRKIDELKKREEQNKQDQNQRDQQQNKDQKNQQQNQNNQQQQQQPQQNKDQKNNDQKNQSQDERSDSKNQKGDGKDQPQDSKDQNGGSGDQKNEPKDSKGNQQKPNGSKDQKGDNKNEQPKDQQASGQQKKDEPKDQKADATKQQGGQDKKDQQQQQQAGAKSDKGEQEPQPADAAKKPVKGDIQAANGEKSQDAQDRSAAEERRERGALTKEEAKQLLDALKNDERNVPAISQQGRGAQQPDDQKILRDW